jgi:hypothetical protein
MMTSVVRRRACTEDARELMIIGINSLLYAVYGGQNTGTQQRNKLF